jgi:hypothetical protein
MPTASVVVATSNEVDQVLVGRSIATWDMGGILRWKNENAKGGVLANVPVVNSKTTPLNALDGHPKLRMLLAGIFHLTLASPVFRAST